jgi:hypothetical protein
MWYRTSWVGLFFGDEARRDTPARQRDDGRASPAAEGGTRRGHGGARQERDRGAPGDAGRRIAAAVVGAGLALVFAAALERQPTGAFRLDGLALVAGLAPYLLLGVLAAALRGRLIGLVAIALILTHGAAVVATGGEAAALYAPPLVLAALLCGLFPKAARALRDPRE